MIRHLPDACLAGAVLAALALSIDRAPAPAVDLVEAARVAVHRQVGATPPAPAVAGRVRAEPKSPGARRPG